MGCFSPKQPTYTPTAPPQFPTADQLYAAATNYAKTNMPFAYGAREGALQDLQNPTAYYQGFQPTSFEQALGNQQFKNIWPDQQAYMANVLGKSGMASSPVAATTLGNAYGNLATNIGQYLDTQANDRATGSLNARLGIDPSSMVNPFVQTGMNQGNQQAQMDYQYQQALAQQQYQQAIQKFQQQQGMVGTLGTLGGGALGFALGGPSGAMMGANVGGSIFGGSGGGNMGNALTASQYLPQGGIFGNSGEASNVFSSGGRFGSGTSNLFNNTGGASSATEAMKVFGS